VCADVAQPIEEQERIALLQDAIGRVRVMAGDNRKRIDLDVSVHVYLR
jgi:hypothetical protein